jgi:hypothetical protein
MGGTNVHALAALGIGPAVLCPTTRKHQSVGSVIVDDSQLEVLIVRSAID